MPLGSLRVEGADHLRLAHQGVEKPGNLGAMLRTADAAGVDAVVAADPVTDWGNPNVVRASKGTVFALPVASATTAEALEWLADNEVRLVVTTPETDLLHTDVDYTGRVAIAVGQREARCRRRAARGGDPPRADPDARQGQQPQRLGGGGRRPLRGGPPARADETGQTAYPRGCVPRAIQPGVVKSTLWVCHD